MKLIRREERPNGKRISYWWPEINTVAIAKTVMSRAAGVAVFQAALLTILASLALANIHPLGNGFDGWGFLDVGLYGACAYYMAYKQSRVAALLALANYVGGIVNMAVASNFQSHPSFLMIIYVLAYVNAVRAAFMIRRLQKAEMHESTVYGN